MSGGSSRGGLATAIDRDGRFLDVGCASGYLLESVVRWAKHRIEPFGLDFAPRLVELARERLPQWCDRIFLGEALSWDPPRRFDFVRTELCYVTPACERALLERLIDRVVARGGRVIVCSYGSPRSGVPTEPVAARLRSWAFEPDLELTEEAPEGGGADPRAGRVASPAMTEPSRSCATRAEQVRLATIEVMFETHATSTDNESGIASGHVDPPLSSVGEEQARQLGSNFLSSRSPPR